MCPLRTLSSNETEETLQVYKWDKNEKYENQHHSLDMQNKENIFLFFFFFPMKSTVL